MPQSGSTSTFAFVKKWVCRRLMATLYIKVHPLIFSPTQFVVLASYAVRPHMFQVSIKEMKNFNVPLLSDHFCSLMAVNDNKFTHVMFHNLHTVINTICIHSGYVQNIGILDQCNYIEEF